jgi:hypothetical protein
MENITQHSSKTRKNPRLSYAFVNLVWAGILLLVTVLNSIEVAFADPISGKTESQQNAKGVPVKEVVIERYPPQIFKAIRQDLYQRGVTSRKLKVVEASPQTWPDGCLGLAQPGELCTQVLVQGWRFVVSDNGKTWVYRTDEYGINLRLQD